MISSKRKKAKKPVKPGPTHQKHAGRQPDWDPTISDLSGMKLNREEQAKRHAAFVSKNRVQLPETARAEAGHKAASGSQPQEGFWNDVASLDFGAVAKNVYAMQPSCQPSSVAKSDKAQAHQQAGDNVGPGADAGTGPEDVLPSDAQSDAPAMAKDAPDTRQDPEGPEAVSDSPPTGRQRASGRDVQGNAVQRQPQFRVNGLELGLDRTQEQVVSTDATMGSGAVYTQSDEAGFSGRQNLSAGVQQKKLRGQVNGCSLLSDRFSAAVIRPDFGLHSTEEPEPCPLPQRLTKLQRAPMHAQQERQALTEIPMPQLRQRGLPHAPMPKQGTYNGPASLRLRPMSTGLPPTQPVVDVHDSLALSAWAGAGRRSAHTESV
ncbi:hypothetical protein WJX79_001909 [Trebouxia sp. C0005]